MNCTRTVSPSTVLAKQSAAQILKTLNASTPVTFARPAFVGLVQSSRPFSTTKPTQWKEFFPKPDSPSIRETAPAWPHPPYTEPQMNAVEVAHRKGRTMSDKVAIAFVKTLRWGLDIACGYKHGEGQMTERKYMIRNVFLESVAGVPGMVAGMLRHMRSMRTMKRDNGWMETLLEESYNERMHLLTFLKMAEPGWFMRLMVLGKSRLTELRARQHPLTALSGAQGVFFNAFFLSYVISPKICHRFVGYLEEEAVFTYTRQIHDIDAGHLPMWKKMQAPDIAVKYWNMPEGHRSMRDLLLYIRADESKHREVNHTLGNLDQQKDPNPYVSEYKDPSKPHPSKGLEHQRPQGWEREDVI